MKKFLLLLLFTVTAHATLYTPSTGGGGGGAVDSVNGQTGVVVLPIIKNGGNTEGSAISAGTTDSFGLTLKTNNSDRLFINSSGVATIGGDTSSMTSTPNTFGTYKFQTSDDSTSFNVFNNFFSYYGSSGNNKDGTLFRMSLRPGETNFVYSGDYNALRADGYVSQPGIVTNFTGLKTAVSSANGGAIITEAKANTSYVTQAQGVIRNATGSEITSVQATGTDAGTGHIANGIAVKTVIASGSDTSNESRGIYIGNSVTATDTGAKAYAIKSDSTADSKFAGLVEVGSLRIDTAPSTSAATASTHKVAVNINGVTYYLLLTNVP